MISLSLNEASRHFLELVHRVCHRGEAATVMESGVPVVHVAPASRQVTGAELARSWNEAPLLDEAEAERFEQDVLEARRTLPEPAAKWE